MNYSVNDIVYKPVVLYKDGEYFSKIREYKIISKSITEHSDNTIEIKYELHGNNGPIKFCVSQDKMEKFFMKNKEEAELTAQVKAAMGKYTE